MSEYQYYEFQAIDRPLNAADREALRGLSSRARITPTSFTNSYEWGDFRGDPAKLMERWFDLDLYLANWGSRRLMIRLPKRLVDKRRLDVFVAGAECASLKAAGENLILDITRDEVGNEDSEDGSGRLAALAPLRADVLGGDLRLFYLVWLMAVEEDAFDTDDPEPMPGIGPISAPLEAFADFFGIDPDLVEAAAERAAPSLSGDAAREIIATLPDRDKTVMLSRLLDGDPHVAAELGAIVRSRMAGLPQATPRTVGELRERAEAIRLAREQAAAKKHAAEQKRLAAAAEKARKARCAAIEARGDSVWGEVEADIELRNAAGYERAVSLLRDLQTIAEERGTIEVYRSRLRAILARHASKRRFIERLEALR
jgi:hypothetical protein